MIEYVKCECWGTHTSREESSGRYVVRLMSRGDANLRAIRGSTCGDIAVNARVASRYGYKICCCDSRI
jgi:hypothetical protein